MKTVEEICEELKCDCVSCHNRYNTEGLCKHRFDVLCHSCKRIRGKYNCPDYNRKERVLNESKEGS